MTILGCLFCVLKNRFLPGGCWISPRRKNEIVLGSFYEKRLFPIICVQFGVIALVPTSLWHIQWVLTSCLCSWSEASFFAKFRSCLSAFPSERCWHVRRRSHSWLTAGENCLAKFIFILLLGFLKTKDRQQDGVRACTKIIQNESSQNDWTRFHKINFHILHGRYPSKGHLQRDQIYMLIRCYFTFLAWKELKNMPNKQCHNRLTNPSGSGLSLLELPV